MDNIFFYKNKIVIDVISLVINKINLRLILKVHLEQTIAQKLIDLGAHNDSLFLLQTLFLVINDNVKDNDHIKHLCENHLLKLYCRNI